MKKSEIINQKSKSNHPIKDNQVGDFSTIFNMTSLIGFYGPPVRKIYLKIFPVRNLKKVESHWCRG